MTSSTRAPDPGRRHAVGRLTGGALVLGALAGCSAFDYSRADAPEALSRVPPLEPRPRIALVLGAGGPRGYAHLGVLRVLEAAGVRPDLIVGSSVGALIGAFWASGRDAGELDALSRQGGPLTLFDPSPFADRGWIRGQKLQDFVNEGLGGRPLEALPRRLIVTVTRRQDKQPSFIVRGNAGVAVRASSALPDIFSPVGISGVEYEDGDESLPVPVSPARAAGAEFVIAVDVSAHRPATPAEAPAGMRARDERRRARIDPEVARADFLIHPDLGYWASPRQAYFDSARRLGEETARARLASLVAALEARFGPDWRV